MAVDGGTALATTNTSDRARDAVAVVAVADGARVAEPADDLRPQASSLQVPGRRPRGLIDRTWNPVHRPAEAA